MKLSLKIVVFMLFLSASANMLVASGVADSMGVNPQPGADEKLSNVANAADEIDPSSGLGSTLFGMFTSLAITLEAVFYGVYAGPIMLSNLGVPSYLVGFLFAPANLIVMKDLYYALSGRSV